MMPSIIGKIVWFRLDLAINWKWIYPQKSEVLFLTASFIQKYSTQKIGVHHISTAIGQGEILTTPLQIANFSALVANRGYYYVPHVVKEMKDKPLNKTFTTKHDTGIPREFFDVTVSGMAHAVTSGTCRGINLAPEIEVCGKTGTSENPHGDDHSLFMGFAPKDNPEVAIAVIVENGRFGASNAVPIGRLMMQKFFKDSIPPSDKWLEDRIVNTTILPKMYLQNSQKLNAQ